MDKRVLINNCNELFKRLFPGSSAWRYIVTNSPVCAAEVRVTPKASGLISLSDTKLARLDARARSLSTCTAS